MNKSRIAINNYLKRNRKDILKYLSKPSIEKALSNYYKYKDFCLGCDDENINYELEHILKRIYFIYKMYLIHNTTNHKLIVSRIRRELRNESKQLYNKRINDEYERHIKYCRKFRKYLKL